MAINTNPSAPLRHLATFNSSGTFLAPASATIAFVSIHGSSGSGGGSLNVGRYNIGGVGGSSIIAGAFVQITPAGNHTVTVGAGGAVASLNAVGTAGGTTSFDGAISVTGGAGGANSGGRYATGATGAQGTASGTTTLTSLSPAGAIIRTGTISTQNTGISAGGNGGMGGRYQGTAGAAGQVHIYV